MLDEYPVFENRNLNAVLSLPNNHDALDGFTTGEELSLAQDWRAPAACFAALTTTLLLCFESGGATRRVGVSIARFTDLHDSVGWIVRRRLRVRRAIRSTTPATTPAGIRTSLGSFTLVCRLLRFRRLVIRIGVPTVSGLVVRFRRIIGVRRFIGLTPTTAPPTATTPTSTALVARVKVSRIDAVLRCILRCVIQRIRHVGFVGAGRCVVVRCGCRSPRALLRCLLSSFLRCLLSRLLGRLLGSLLRRLGVLVLRRR